MWRALEQILRPATARHGRQSVGAALADATIGDMRELRKERGLTAHALGEMLDPPVRERTIFRWERRESAIPDTRKVELAAVLGVTVDDLMCWTEADE
jgi:DNA-binding transcriptional regulator YiaG